MIRRKESKRCIWVRSIIMGLIIFFNQGFSEAGTLPAFDLLAGSNKLIKLVRISDMRGKGT